MYKRQSIYYCSTNSRFRSNGFDALRFPEAYASIEKADVERFLRENLTDSRRAISIIEPKKEG